MGTIVLGRRRALSRAILSRGRLLRSSSGRVTPTWRAVARLGRQEALREVLQCRLRLRLLLAGQVDPAVAQVSPTLEGQTERVRRGALRRELEDAGVVRIIPKLGDELLAEVRRLEPEL